MVVIDEHWLYGTAARARATLEELAAELPYAAPAEREALRAGINCERWLLQCCATVRKRSRPPV